MNPFFQSQYESETSEIYNPFSGEGRESGSLSLSGSNSSSSSSAGGSTNRRRTSTLGADSELKPFSDATHSGPSSPSSSSSSSLYVGLYQDDDGLVPHSAFDELDICGLDSLPILVRVIEAVTTAPDVGKNYTKYHFEVQQTGGVVGSHQIISKVSHRFSKILRFHSDLKKIFKSTALPEPPPKRVFQDNMDPTFIDQRKADIDQYVQDLCKITKVRQSFLFQWFFKMHDLRGRVFVVTGLGNNKIASTLIKKLVFRGATVVAGGKDAALAEELMTEIKSKKYWDQNEGGLEFLPLDQNYLQSVKDFAIKFEEKALPLHYLILLPDNQPGAKHEITNEGFDSCYVRHYLAQYYMTNLLLPILRRSEPSRIVLSGSKVHFDADTLQLPLITPPRSQPLSDQRVIVEQASVATILFLKELTNHLSSSSVSAVACETDSPSIEIWSPVARLMEDLITMKPEEAAVQVAFSAFANETRPLKGAYCQKFQVAKPNPIVHDEILRQKLWEVSSLRCALEVPCTMSVEF
eukprot:TRINITY_DN3669_c0_g1_i1.p1 TRINITY_DN3669_c0_g1~~TRINITY_DN3669_c0_g1_i1.p1  ORF type:complete len:535 (-),score=196.14 TRINITY_DN3669_c0_g1_i1:22-1587(-)